MGIVDLGKVRGTQTYTGNKITGSNANATVFPETGIAKAYEGDLYINTDVLSEFKGNVYECTVAGEPDAAKWIFKGSIRGPKVDTVNNLKSTSTEDALSAYQGKRLLDMMKEAGVFSRKVVVDYDGTVFGVKLTIDNVNSTFTFLINGSECRYTYEAAGEAETTILSVSIGTNLGMSSNGGIISEIRSSEANIYSYILMDNTSASVYSKTTDIWGEVNDNKQSHEITGTIVDGDETFCDGPIRKVVNGIKKVFFPITHAKAVWFEKRNGVTVYDKIVELVSGISNEILNRKKAVEELSASMASEITGLRNSTSSQISNEASERKAADDTLAARMDTFTKLPTGSTTGDAELQDIRVGADGKVYGSAGAAVRGQVSELKGDTGTFADNTELDSDIKSVIYCREYNSNYHKFLNNNKRLSVVIGQKYNFPVKINLSNFSNYAACTIRTWSTQYPDLETTEIISQTTSNDKIIVLPANVYWTITISKIGNAEIAESEKECLQFEYYNKMLEQAKAECTDAIEKNADAIGKNTDAIGKNTDAIGKNTDAIEFLRQPIPSYYFENNYMDSKINEIREHTRTARGISFAFITDLHIKNNVGNSKFLLKHILDRTTVPFIICGGDIGSAYSAEYGKEKEETISEANQWLDYIGYVGKDLVFQVRGNHDHNKQSETGAGDKKYYSMFDYEVYDYNTRSLESKVNTHPNRNYYYIDNVSNKVRIVFLDEYKTIGTTGIENTLEQAQVSWLLNDALNVDGYSFIFVSHQTFDSAMPYCDTVWEPIQGLMRALKNKTEFSYHENGISIDVDFTYSTNDFVCHVSGHSHKDESNVDNGVLSITTGSDSFVAYDDPNVSREIGTVTEQLFDVFSIDTANKTIKTVRIGGGDNREWSY